MTETDDDDFDGRNDPTPRDLEAMDLIKELEGKTLQQLLEDGQKMLIVELLAKVKSGQASHQELAILRNLLRDNGMVLGAGRGGPNGDDEGRPKADLPEFEDPDYEA